MLQASALAALSLGLYVVVYREPMRCFIYSKGLYCLNDSLVHALFGCFIVFQLPTGLELASC